MKKCINCGAELPDEAAYCPHCETSQVKKRLAKPPKRCRRAPVAAVCALLAAGIFAAALTYGGASEAQKPAATPTGSDAGTAAPSPDIGGIGAETVYTAPDGTAYRLFLTFYYSESGVQSPTAERENFCAEGSAAANPSQLYVYSAADGSPANDEFIALVGASEVEAVPRDGAAAMDCSIPAADASFPYAALVSHVVYTYGCGTNDILWTLKLKNGDIVQLRQSITVIDMETQVFTPEDTPMDTIEDLRALMDFIDRDVPKDAAVDIYLPPVRYEGELQLARGRGVSLYGSSDGESVTTFTGTVTVNSAYMQLTDLVGIRFEGSGGVGVLANDGVQLEGCTFTGWDTGAEALNGSWIGASNCTFADNGVGLHFNTNESYHYSNPSYTNDVFLDNGTALLIEQLPGDEVLRFPQCSFSGNGEDIVNPDGHPLDASGAGFD